MPDIRCIAVVGTGAMGTGIAQIAAQAGLTVWLFDSRAEAAAEATPAPAADLREPVRQRQAERRRRRGRAKPAAGGGTPGTTGRLRTGGGGHRRAPGGQAGIAAPAGSHSRAGDHPRQQYLVAVDHRHRRRLRAAAAGRRFSLLQPGAADARGRGGRRPGQRSGSRRRPARPRRAPGPPRRTDQGQPRLHRQPCRPRLWHRGPAHPRRRRRRMRRDRPCAARVCRLPHGAVRTARSYRPRRVAPGNGIDLPAVLPGTALPPAPADPPVARRRPSRAQERPGLLSLRRRPAAGQARSATGAAGRHPAPGVAGLRKRGRPPHARRTAASPRRRAGNRRTPFRRSALPAGRLGRGPEQRRAALRLSRRAQRRHRPALRPQAAGAA